MADQICDQCNKLFEDGDQVKAVVLSKFKSLKSSRVYAIGFPTDCLSLEHKNCQYPKGDIPDED